MPIEGVNQPDYIVLDDELRLKKFNGVLNFAIPWYRDPHFLAMVDGPAWEPYDLPELMKVFEYLEQHGEVYIIEQRLDGFFEPIGDVSFWQEDIPIAIGVEGLRGKGIGKKVLQALIARGRELGYSTLEVQEIYHYNVASQALFESVGFRKDKKTKDGFSYIMLL